MCNICYICLGVGMVIGAAGGIILSFMFAVAFYHDEQSDAAIEIKERKRE